MTQLPRILISQFSSHGKLLFPLFFVFHLISDLILKICHTLHFQIMKSYIWLETADGSIQQVEQEVAMFCPVLCHDILQKGMGSSKNNAISLPPRVNTAMWSLILEYCQFHQAPGRSNKVGDAFNSLNILMFVPLAIL